jgi:hypothetical protein
MFKVMREKRRQEEVVRGLGSLSRLRHADLTVLPYLYTNLWSADREKSSSEIVRLSHSQRGGKRNNTLRRVNNRDNEISAVYAIDAREAKIILY